LRQECATEWGRIARRTASGIPVTVTVTFTFTVIYDSSDDDDAGEMLGWLSDFRDF
jgi:hypothetical protein